MAYKRQTDRLPIIPADAQQRNVVCHYCIVGCGYHAYTWDMDKQGTTDPSGNVFKTDLSKQQGAETEAWYAPSMYNVVKQDGRDVHLVIKPDNACVVNSGLGSVRGARMAEMTYSGVRNTEQQRLTDPMVWRYGQMQPTSWDDALDLVARVTAAVIAEKGEDALFVSAYDHGGAGGGYENTWGTGKLYFVAMKIKNIRIHNRPAYNSEVHATRDMGIGELNNSGLDRRALHDHAGRLSGRRSGSDGPRPFEARRGLLESVRAHRPKPGVGDELTALLVLVVAVHEGVFLGLPVEALELGGQVGLPHVPEHALQIVGDAGCDQAVGHRSPGWVHVALGEAHPALTVHGRQVHLARRGGGKPYVGRLSDLGRDDVDVDGEQATLGNRVRDGLDHRRTVAPGDRRHRVLHQIGASLVGVLELQGVQRGLVVVASPNVMHAAVPLDQELVDIGSRTSDMRVGGT